MKNSIVFTACAGVVLALGVASAIVRETAPIDPGPKVLAPEIVFKGTRKAPGAKRESLVFEIVNPNAEGSVSFFAYLREASNPPIRDGVVSPLYVAKDRIGKQWTERKIGWCGTGAEMLTLAPKCRAKFTVYPMQQGPVDAMKVGVHWGVARGGGLGDWEVAWSDAVPKGAIGKTKPEK